MFHDRAHIHALAGRGGDGGLSFRREKYVPKGGPDGGDGGRGGDVVVYVDPSLRDLTTFRRIKHVKAGKGGNGRGSKKHGADGDDAELRVPVGTQLIDGDGRMVADLTSPNGRVVVARGGQGGRGNARFATPTRQTPRFAETGLPGNEIDLELRLKLVVDAALAGFPNAGKSSLLRRMSNAKPKVADYPFTTLEPVLGVVDGPDERQLTVADVPGLIPGAHLGRGLGLEFLRHVERCSVLAHVIDCATLEPGRDPLTDLEVIEEELAAYVPDADLGGRPLAERTRVIILNKADVPEARELAEMVKPDLEERGYEVHIVSAVAHIGLTELTYALGRLVTAARADFAEIVPPRIVLRPRAVDDSGFVIRREDTPDGPAYRVVGERPTRWVRQTDFANDEAVGYLADRLGRLGVEEALVKAGAVAGDTVLIGAADDAVVFDWEPTLISGAELLGQRGSDLRLSESQRATRDEKRESAHDRYVARQATQSDLEAERRAGHWATARDETDED